LATFLLQIARIGYGSKINYENSLQETKSVFDLHDFCILLQCQSESGEALHCFHAVGFTEFGHVDRKSEVDNDTYDGFSKHYTSLSRSKTDFIHFIIGGKKDLVVLKHVSDGYYFINTQIGQHKVVRLYKPLVFHEVSQKDDSLFFPCHMKREHILVLSHGLDLFYLPFQQHVNLDNYLTPNEEFVIQNSITVYGSDLEIAGSDKRWYKSRMIDFLSRW